MYGVLTTGLTRMDIYVHMVAVFSLPLEGYSMLRHRPTKTLLYHSGCTWYRTPHSYLPITIENGQLRMHKGNVNDCIEHCGQQRYCKGFNLYRMNYTCHLFTRSPRTGAILQLTDTIMDAVEHYHLGTCGSRKNLTTLQFRPARIVRNTGCYNDAECNADIYEICLPSYVCGCDDYACEDEPVSEVCGSDMVTYNSECHLILTGCQENKDLTVSEYNACDSSNVGRAPNITIECTEDTQCEGNEVCSGGICSCEQECPDKEPVCGTDNVTYTSKCNLLKTACVYHRNLTVSTDGRCAGHVCDDDKQCEGEKLCKDGDCNCDRECEDGDTICGMDNVTYSSECEMRKTACFNNTTAAVQHTGECLECSSDDECPDDEICDQNGKCVCNPTCPAGAEVCGSDNATYANECEMKKHRCINHMTLEKSRDGRCPDCSTNEECPGYQICDGNGYCGCEYDCPEDEDEVCGMDNNTYMNECELKLYNCMNNLSIDVQGQRECAECSTDDECPDDEICGDDGFCDCEQTCPPGEEVCGSDNVTYANECELKKHRCTNHVSLTITRESRCPECSTDDECSGYQICDDDGYCGCDYDCLEDEYEVCGMDNNTYINECELKLYNCLNNESIEVQSQGECAECSTDEECPDDEVCGDDGFCNCNRTCPPGEEVCGSDNVTYANECEVKKHRCTNHLSLTITHEKRCPECSTDDECPGYQICDDDGYCGCNYDCAEDQDEEEVCGMDNNTYMNECELKSYNCLNNESIELQGQGECAECSTDEECPDDEVCGDNGFCNCNRTCQPGQEVCGSDNLTYANECEVKKHRCTNHLSLSITREARCPDCSTDDECPEYEICDYDGYCGCDYECPEDGSEICGMDNITYPNECRLKLYNCENNMSIPVQGQGKCAECSTDEECPDDEVCGDDGICKCNRTCPPGEEVCGSDNVTYSSECDLKMHRCINHITLTILREERCPDCYTDEECPNYQKCDANGYCNCVYDCADGASMVCGMDNNTYTNECELEQYNCFNNLSTAVQGPGQCAECSTDHECPDDEICDDNGFCNCNRTCPPGEEVCGSDNITYANECELKKHRCIRHLAIIIERTGKCPECSTDEECPDDKICDDYGFCTCNRTCQPGEEVCGSDDITYESECEMLKHRCMSGQVLNIERNGKCPECSTDDECPDDEICNDIGFCNCSRTCPPGELEVCGSDNVTYSSECELKQIRCVNHMTVNKISDGPCPVCSTDGECPKNHICLNGECSCQRNCQQGEEVCGSDGKTYLSTCHLVEYNCMYKTEITEVPCEVCWLGVHDTYLKALSTINLYDDITLEQCKEECIKSHQYSKVPCKSISYCLPPAKHCELTTETFSTAMVGQFKQSTSWVYYERVPCPVKPGLCPRIAPKSPCSIQKDECQVDNNCPGSAKCCWDKTMCPRKCEVPAVLTPRPSVPKCDLGWTHTADYQYNPRSTPVLLKLTDVSVDDCKEKCWGMDNCKSFTYHRNQTRSGGGGSVDWSFFEREKQKMMDRHKVRLGSLPNWGSFGRRKRQGWGFGGFGGRLRDDGKLKCWLFSTNQETGGGPKLEYCLGRDFYAKICEYRS